MSRLSKVFSLQPYSSTPLRYDVNPSSNPSSRVLNYNRTVHSEEVLYFFGELQVYGELLVRGEAAVLRGNVVDDVLSGDVSTPRVAYGPVVVVGTSNVTEEYNVL